LKYIMYLVKYGHAKVVQRMPLEAICDIAQ
jgi:hypothetical protein